MALAAAPSSRGRGLQIVRRDAWMPEHIAREVRAYSPRTDLGRLVKEAFAYLPTGLVAELLDRIKATLVCQSQLSAIRFNGPESDRPGTADDFGVLSHKVVTTAGVNWLATAFINTVEPEIMKYHGVGTGSTAEAAADTALVTESTTALNPDNTRATGTGSNPSANVYRSVGTNAFDASAGLNEHGLFSQAATGGGTLLDRSVFASVLNVVSGDSLQTTYDLTLASGG